MWLLHQTAKQASHYYSNTGRRSVLKLQSIGKGLLTVTETVTQREIRPNKGVLLTDSLSVLQSLASGNPEEVYTAELQ